MARRTRLFVTDIPCHVTQRGNNKNPIFFTQGDYLYFLDLLKEAKEKHPCTIFAYCLMPNHFHLFMKSPIAQNISLFMKFLGSKYVRYINKKYTRSGTLWEGRFKASLVDAERYFIFCLMYIETNPVRARIVSSPELYRWSSFNFRAFGKSNPLLTLDHWYNSLGKTPVEKQQSYRDIFRHRVFRIEADKIREATNKGWILGNEGLKEYVERIKGDKLIFRQPGRPKKAGQEIYCGHCGQEK